MAVLRALERCYLRLPSLGNNTAMIAKASLKVKISRERSVKVLRVCTCLHLRRHPCAHARVHVCYCGLVCALRVSPPSRELRVRVWNAAAILPR
jgi:hypothetical protein